METLIIVGFAHNELLAKISKGQHNGVKNDVSVHYINTCKIDWVLEILLFCSC